MTQYLYGSLSNPLQVTASRAPDNTLTVYYYDDFGALYAFERGGARYYVGSDHLGTPKVITDNTGAILRQIEYDSWGVKISDTNPSFDLRVGFAGGIPDDATGLVRFGLRDYEPGTGRWAAKDPIFQKGGLNLYQYVESVGKPLSGLNLYVYAGNSPVNYVVVPEKVVSGRVERAA
jgi:RHS repeat-associated protein